jgi:pimeloyl-ACP methyl ester carboxylesterase
MEGALEQVWVLDSNPGPQQSEMDSEIRRVVQALERVQMPLKRRADVVPLLRREGLSIGIANWMTTNLERTEQGDYRWAFDLDRIKELLIDYAATDLWPYLQQRDQTRLDLHVVVAERSERLDAPLRERLRRLESEQRLRYHLLENAGHWLHVDNPDGLLALLAADLPR